MSKQRGDTLVEVMLATVIMSIVVTASFALINRASRINQVSSERSDAANAMQTQAEILRLLRDKSFNSEAEDITWQQIKDDRVLPGDGQSNNECLAFLRGETDNLTGSGAFYIDPNTQEVTDFNSSQPANFNDLHYVWIEAFQPTGASDNYINFYVHACWQGPGGTGPQQASLIYRLRI